MTTLRTLNRNLVTAMGAQQTAHNKSMATARASMTRQHFKSLAEALKESNAPFDVCARIASTLAQYNSRFNSDKFMEACGH